MIFLFIVCAKEMNFSRNRECCRRSLFLPSMLPSAKTAVSQIDWNGLGEQPHYYKFVAFLEQYELKYCVTLKRFAPLGNNGNVASVLPVSGVYAILHMVKLCYADWFFAIRGSWRAFVKRKRVKLKSTKAMRDLLWAMFYV